MRVVLDHITKRFSDVTAVSEFNATLEDGELVSLLGPSGCGKSTLLNMLSGILPVSGGKIYFDDQDVTSMPPEKRGIGLVFQNYALYPHMTVMGNICFPLETQRVPKAERIERANEIAKLVHVDMLMNRKPSEPASSSVSPLPVRWSKIPVCCCLTSRFPTLTRVCVLKCAKRFAAFSSARVSPRSSLRMIRRKRFPFLTVSC